MILKIIHTDDRHRVFKQRGLPASTHVHLEIVLLLSGDVEINYARRVIGAAMRGTA